MHTECSFNFFHIIFRFQPGSGAVISAPSTVSKHHSAVEQRVRVLLNVPEGVKISTSGNPEAKQKDEQQRVEPKKSAGVKRKAFEQPAPLPPSLPDNQSIACKTSSDPVLQPDYKGLRLLQKFGWQGEALGKSGGTANAPIEVYKISDRAGLGSEAHQKACQKPAVQSCSSDLSRGATGQVAPTIDEKLDSEKTKAWKRMMLRFNEPR